MRPITALDRHGVTSRKGVATRAWVQVSAQRSRQTSCQSDTLLFLYGLVDPHDQGG